MNKNGFLWAVALMAAAVSVSAQEVRMKIVENGGRGQWKAVVTEEPSLPDFTIYRPVNMAKAVREGGKLPVLLWANGACSNSSWDYQNMLNEIASHGYVVVAIGRMKMVQGERKDGGSESVMMKQALNWVMEQARMKGSKYRGRVNVKAIAAAGHSCGGAQTLFNCGNRHIKTCLIMNAGMGKMEMAGASPASLLKLHGPVIYMSGGPSDVAYGNAKIDFESIGHVPVVWADNEKAGHGGTYGAPAGGSFGRLALLWLDWQLKGKRANRAVFTQEGQTMVPEFKIQQRNF